VKSKKNVGIFFKIVARRPASKQLQKQTLSSGEIHPSTLNASFSRFFLSLSLSRRRRRRRKNFWRQIFLFFLLHLHSVFGGTVRAFSAFYLSGKWISRVGKLSWSATAPCRGRAVSRNLGAPKKKWRPKKNLYSASAVAPQDE
jgi:hypothetical protein